VYSYSGFVHHETSPDGRTRRLGVLAALLAAPLALGLTGCAKAPLDSSPATTAAPTASPATTPSVDSGYDSGYDTPTPTGTGTDAPDSQQTVDHSQVTPPPPSDLTLSASMTLDGPHNVVRVVANISNIVTNDGQCVITVGSYSTTAPVVANAKDSSCQINQIPIGQIKHGDTFTITATSGTLAGTTTGKVQ